MKLIKLLLTLSFLLIILSSCSKQVEKPKITLSGYNEQAVTSKGVISKIMAESDYKRMHEIALAIESSRSISCIAVAEECNVLSQILNLIVKSTNDGLPKEVENVEIYKKIGQLDEEFKLGKEKLEAMWREYNKAIPTN